nr:hypothetical protein [Acidobacteriota bacterium]
MKETHPARNAEFLSRLHDGELSAAERAHFESHRAHCSDCRRAAAEFESALSLYRSSRPTPASPDLAGRILRKLQTSTPRRPRFGPSFGIDLRWAGAFAAAVVAAIIGSTIIGRHEARESLARSTAPIPIVVQSRPVTVSEPSSPAAAPPSDAPQAIAKAPRRAAPFSGALAKKNEPGEPSSLRAPREQRRAKPEDEKDANGRLSASSQDRQESGSVAGIRERENEKRDVKEESAFAARRPGTKSALSAAPAPEAASAPQPPANAGAAPAMPAAPRAQSSEVAAVAQAGRARLRVEALDGMPD